MIAILSDLGNSDGALASIKGVIKTINPKVEIQDIAHDISSYSIREGAFVLKRCYHYFPPETIFLAIIDPGDDSKRKPVLLEMDHYFFIAPDNEILTYIIQDADSYKLYEITNPNFRLKKISRNFHGRDILAPAAAYLSISYKSLEFGEELTSLKTFPSHMAKQNGQEWVGEVVFIDQFGNVCTNIKETMFTEEILQSKYEIHIGKNKIDHHLSYLNFFSDVPKETALIYIGDSWFLELALRENNFQKAFNVQIGDSILIKKIATPKPC